MIIGSNLHRIYGKGSVEVRALDGVDISIRKGEFGGVTGASGSGKSTLLHLLGLLDRPTSGSLVIDGVNVGILNDRQRTLFGLNRLGYVFQDYALVPELTAEENIYLPSKVRGMTSRECTRACREILGLRVEAGTANGRAAGVINNDDGRQVLVRSYPLVNPEEAAKKAYMLLQCFREHSGHPIHIQHISLKPDATFFIKGDSGSDIHDSVAHFEGEPIVYKHYPNSFRETNLLEMLEKWDIERVVICGMMTHMCVDATVRAAADLGFQVIIAEDACATRDLKYDDTVIPADLVHKSFVAALKSYGKVMKSEEIHALLAGEMVK